MSQISRVRYLNTKKTLALTKASRSTLSRWIRAGKLRPLQPTRHLLFDESEVLAFLQSSRRSSDQAVA